MYAHGYEGEGPVSAACAPRRSTSILPRVGMLGPHPVIEAKAIGPIGSSRICRRCAYASSKSSVSRAGRLFTVSPWEAMLPSRRSNFIPRSIKERWSSAASWMASGSWIGLYAYTAAAEYFSATPLLDTPRPDFDALATVAWPKLMGTPGDYTERGRHFDSVMKHLSGGDVPLRLEGMKQRYFLNLNPRQLSARGAQEFARHADTRHVRYDIDPGHGLDAAELNRDIRRVTAVSGARSREANPVFAEMTGKIQVPLLTIHETADFRVPLPTCNKTIAAVR